MKRSSIFSIVAVMLMFAFSMSSCVYHSRGPVYDNGYGYGPGYRYNPGYGYGYGYRRAVPPPRPIVVVPSQPRGYRDNGRYGNHNRGRSNRNFSRQSSRQYSHNGRHGGPR